MIPLWFKLSWLAFLAVLVPVYLQEYGPLNFLWLSSIALVGGCVAAWLENRRLASMLLVAVLLPELVWVLDLVLSLLLLGNPVIGAVHYMYNTDIPLHVRLLSLYHLPLPFALLWMVWRLGYDAQAWKWWLPIGWGVLLASYAVAEEGGNLNWVLGPHGQPQEWVAPELWLAFVVLFCTVMWWLTHRLVRWVYRWFGGARPGVRE